MATTTDRSRFDARHGVEDERSLGQVAGDLIGHSKQLIRGEFAIAKREIADSAKQVGSAAAIGGAALPFAFAAAVLLGCTLAFALAEVMPTWAGFAIATVVFVAITAIFALVAKARVQDASLAPTQTIDSTKEDLSWIRQHMN